MYTIMKKTINILFFTSLSFCGVAYCLADEFEKVECGSDIPKAMLGQYSPNEKVVVIENRHTDIGLKNLVAEDLGTANEQFASIHWMICGNRYISIIADHHIRGVMQLPPENDDSSDYTGKCKSNNKEIPGWVFAILHKNAITEAWKIDKKKGFLRLETEGLECE